MEFRLSSLSPAQLERASFTPQKQWQPTSSEPSAEKDAIILRLECRVAAQEERILNLENEMREYCSTHGSPSRGYGSAQCPQRVKLAAVPDRIHAFLNESPPSTPSPDPRGDSKGAVDGYIQTQHYTPSSSNASQENPPYHFDDLLVFEAIINSKDTTTKVATSPEGAEVSADTLIEGIGCASEIIHHPKDAGEPEKDAPLPSHVNGRNTRQPNVLPWDGTIKWTAFLEQPALKEKSGNPLTRSRRSNSDSWQTELIFSPTIGRKNVYRTVAIADLPLGITLKTLFSGIRGGMVYSAHLVNMAHIAGSHMGIVTFVLEIAAREFVNFAAEHGVFFNGKRATVTLFKTPTYPIPGTMFGNIFGKKQTRCILIDGHSDLTRCVAVAKFLKEKLPLNSDLGDTLVSNSSNTLLHVRFNSIHTAGLAMNLLRSFHRLDNCVMSFAADPCAQPLPHVGE
ncbi:hypothetical protein AJ80_09736 [Polytolypa hystricis UAMH7299]|uniref:Uncharacterized protein n=1 Tax=Polytolypa hystricis (strain UAMH7299) TaxID=1447883 RepID=A0A2B7WKI7_POLH7|nr:hypothetical protein AJ80_09736 [Polytolypa hystricis UAMH7299]